MFKKMFQLYQQHKIKIKGKKEKELQFKKDFITQIIKSSISKEHIHDYNTLLILNSAGWIGGDKTEYDLKNSILKDYNELFSFEEYEKLFNYIEKNADRKFTMF